MAAIAPVTDGLLHGVSGLTIDGEVVDHRSDSASLTLLPGNFSRVMRRKSRNHYNVSQNDSSLAMRLRDIPRSSAARCRRSIGGCLCVSLFLCSPLFASLLLPKPMQLTLLRRSLRLRLRPRSPTTCQWIGGRQFCNTYCF